MKVGVICVAAWRPARAVVCSERRQFVTDAYRIGEGHRHTAGPRAFRARPWYGQQDQDGLGAAVEALDAIGNRPGRATLVMAACRQWGSRRGRRTAGPARIVSGIVSVGYSAPRALQHWECTAVAWLPARQPHLASRTRLTATPARLSIAWSQRPDRACTRAFCYAMPQTEHVAQCAERRRQRHSRRQSPGPRRGHPRPPASVRSSPIRHRLASLAARR